MEFRNVESGDYEAIRTLLADNRWGKRVADADRFKIMIESASRTVVAVDEGRVIGFARALCDEVSNGYIGTVVVAQEKRGRGIGLRIVRELIGSDPNITWVLRAGRGSEKFWRKAGFTPSSVAMERLRQS